MKNRRSVRLSVEELESRLAPSAAPTLVGSTNWSGYAVTSALQQISSNTYQVLEPVTDVKGSWVVPKIQSTLPGENSYSSTWVGIDGAGSPTVEQIGTDSDVVNGTPTYYAWWEMYPGPSYYVTKLAIHPGDSISAEVKYDNSFRGYSGFALTLKDVTTNKSFSTAQYISGAALYSAEWIEEAPSSASSGSELPLSNFGTVTFSNAQATLGGKTDVINGATWASQGDSLLQINMVTLDANGNVTGTLASTAGAEWCRKQLQRGIWLDDSPGTRKRKHQARYYGFAEQPIFSRTDHRGDKLPRRADFRSGAGVFRDSEHWFLPCRLRREPIARVIADFFRLAGNKFARQRPPRRERRYGRYQPARGRNPNATKVQCSAGTRSRTLAAAHSVERTGRSGGHDAQRGRRPNGFDGPGLGRWAERPAKLRNGHTNGSVHRGTRADGVRFQRFSPQPAGRR